MAEGGGERGHREGVRQTLPLGIAVLGFGISFGVLARAAGMGWAAPLVMSATTFAGSAQFAAASVLNAGGAVGAAVVAAVLLNARYAPIGVSVAPYLEGPWWSRLLRGQLVVDESWAIAAEGDGRYNPKVLVGAGLTIYVGWVAGTAIGVAFGNLIGDPARLGLDAAFPALLPRPPRAPADVARRSVGGAARAPRSRCCSPLSPRRASRSSAPARRACWACGAPSTTPRSPVRRASSRDDGVGGRDPGGRGDHRDQGLGARAAGRSARCLHA